MIEFPTWFSGSVTLVALIGLGIFLYPWLLRRPGGRAAVGAMTVVLIIVFYLFDRSLDTPIFTSWLFAALWAAAPAAVALFLHRMYRRNHPANAESEAAPPG
jgi:hypothetical protein